MSETEPKLPGCGTSTSTVAQNHIQTSCTGRPKCASDDDDDFDPCEVEGESQSCRRKWAPVHFDEMMPKIKAFLQDYVAGKFGPTNKTPFARDLYDVWIKQGGAQCHKSVFSAAVGRFCERFERSKTLQLDLNKPIAHEPKPLAPTKFFTAHEIPICSRCKIIGFEYPSYTMWRNHLSNANCLVRKDPLCYCVTDSGVHHHRCPKTILHEFQRSGEVAVPLPNQNELRPQYKHLETAVMPSALPSQPRARKTLMAKPRGAAVASSAPPSQPLADTVDKGDKGDKGVQEPPAKRARLSLEDDDLKYLVTVAETDSKRLEDSRSILEQEVKTLGRECDDIRDHWRQLRVQVLNEEKPKTQLETMVSEAGSACDALSQHLLKLRDEHNALKKRLADANAKFHDTATRIRTLEEQRDAKITLRTSKLGQMETAAKGASQSKARVKRLRDALG